MINYAISIANAAGASQILLTGVDGYDKSDSRQQEMVLSLSKFKENNTDVEICAVTPTTYPISQVLISNLGI